ncbi:Nn.00g105790.m01.CDS01 [Neocucurbitaria sp. VM-36]
MTKTAKHGMQKRKIKASPQGKDEVAWKLSNANNVFVHRISQRAMVTDAFYERFLAYFTSEGEGKDIQNRLTWLHRLPLLSTDGTDDALVLALQATASAYCAVDSRDPALTRHAWDLYGDALRIHGRTVARSTSKHQVTLHMVSTSVLFSFFEAMQATNANAYRSHIYGAAKMLEVTGPGQCTQGVLCQIFYHLRTQMAFVHLTGSGNEKPVEVRKILHGTLEYTRLPMFQRLMSHVATLAEIEVEVLWHEYNDTANDLNERLIWEDSSSGATTYRDAFTALTIAYFETARVLLAIVAPQLAASFVDLNDHYAAIMETAQYLQIHDIGCAYMRMATPLLLVALHSPKKEQRKAAINYFECWAGGSMRGISTLALQSIYRQRASKPQTSLRSSMEDTPNSSKTDGWPISSETNNNEIVND